MWPLNPWQISAAIVIDLALGDPHGWPHIARYAGALSLAYERWLTGVPGFEFRVPGSGFRVRVGSSFVLARMPPDRLRLRDDSREPPPSCSWS
jgi:hypothetical protein